MFWKKKKSSPDTASEPEAIPEIIDLSPGHYAVHLYKHQLPTISGTIPCWTYRSAGLMRLKQREISLTLLLRHDAPAPSAPMHFFGLLYRMAAEGRIVTTGGWTQFGENRFFDRHLVYIPTHTIATLPAAPDSLMAISVTDRELAEVQRYGILRLMARLGQQARYYPCPPWLDPARADTASEQDQVNTILADPPCLHLPPARVLKIGTTLVLRLSRKTGTYLGDSLREVDAQSPLALLLGLDNAADGCLVWVPGQTDTAAITPPGSTGERLCGCFILFVPHQESAGYALVEDGFAVTCTAEQWSAIRQALLKGKPLQIKAADGKIPLRIEWDSA